MPPETPANVKASAFESHVRPATEQTVVFAGAAISEINGLKQVTEPVEQNVSVMNIAR